MIIYRPHRGSLDDSMKEKKEFANFKEIASFISNQYEYIDGSDIYKVEDIVLHGSSYDDNRIGWRNVRHVCINGYYEYSGEYIDYIKTYGCPQCIGMCSDDYDE